MRRAGENSFVNVKFAKRNITGRFLWLRRWHFSSTDIQAKRKKGKV